MANKPLSFKDFVTVDYLPGTGEYISWQAHKRKRGAYDTQGESVEQVGVDEGIFAKWKQKSKDKKYNAKNAAFQKRSQKRKQDSQTKANDAYAKVVGKERDGTLPHSSKVGDTVQKIAARSVFSKHRLKNLPRLPEEVEVDEALTHQQRVKASIRMKKMKSKIKMGRDRAAKRSPTMDVVKKRAFRKARLAVLKKMTKGQTKGDLSFSRRADVEKRLEKKKALIQRLAKKLIPDVRKIDRERRAAK